MLWHGVSVIKNCWNKRRVRTKVIVQPRALAYHGPPVKSASSRRWANVESLPLLRMGFFPPSKDLDGPEVFSFFFFFYFIPKLRSLSSSSDRDVNLTCALIDLRRRKKRSRGILSPTTVPGRREKRFSARLKMCRRKYCRRNRPAIESVYRRTFYRIDGTRSRRAHNICTTLHAYAARIRTVRAHVKHKCHTSTRYRVIFVVVWFTVRTTNDW